MYYILCLQFPQNVGWQEPENGEEYNIEGVETRKTREHEWQPQIFHKEYQQ